MSNESPIIVRTREGKPVDVVFGPNRTELSREIVRHFARTGKHTADLFRSIYGPRWFDAVRENSNHHFSYVPTHRKEN